MRLLNTQTLKLSEFNGDTAPPYAILSHTWVEGQEVGFHDSVELKPSATTTSEDNNDNNNSKTGFRKVQGACRKARDNDIGWIWIDTVCIDKTSSAELTEAINSMYHWYKRSKICYAFLCDVPALDTGDQDPLSLFRQSRWWRWGWTLQELIAPPQVVFYSNSWDRIGDRSTSLAEVISFITGIETPVFLGEVDLHQVSVARRMSWAATRMTSRVEDVAYCLLGIFDVNMPLLYGEGPKAFMRLQEEIIKTSSDQTVFCWSRGSGRVPLDWTSVLAPSPAAFLHSGDYVAIDAWDFPMPYSMTNLGLSIHLPVIYTLTQLFVVLDAGLPGSGSSMRACIAMQRTNQRRSGSSILDRSPFLESPVMLSKEATDTRERYNLFIRSKFVPRIEAHRPSWPLKFKHAVLLFVDPTAVWLLSTSRRGMPLGSVGFDIETHPPGIFDDNTSLLKLPAFDGGSSLLTSGLVRICFKSPQIPSFYLFFAVITTLGGKEVWHCETHFEDDFDYIRLALKDYRESQDGFGSDGELLMEDIPSERMLELIHQSLRYEAWEIPSRQMTAHSSDESLFVSIGGPIQSDSETDIRAAVLSGKWDSVCPIPHEMAGTIDDVTDDTDEDEDWNSEDGEDDSDAMKASTQSLPPWDRRSGLTFTDSGISMP
ncbi:HET-domain-containing protein [Xylariaceae sp. FL0016]|nr:HET-domain-containing protein [Xylariaceae sp. FL0016]